MAIHWKELDRLARAHRLIDATSSEEALRRQLELWWCIKYSRPFKDPLLKDYTTQELIYEYLTYYYLDSENDPKVKEQNEKQSEEDLAWVYEQQRKIQEAQSKKQAQPSPPKIEQKPNENQGSESSSESTALPELPEISTKFEE